MLKEFTEFPTPEEQDYDINSSKDDVQRPGELNQYFMEILDMVGFLEDGEWNKYGISENEYMHPTQDTVDKIRTYLETKETSVSIKK